MMELLFPVLLVAGIGLVAGLGLAIASAVMAVPKDEKAEAIQEMLPGANCGACGFSGCSGYAAALAKGEAKPGLCSPGGAEVAAEISAFLGLGGVDVEKKVAVVRCSGSEDYAGEKMRYAGIESCAAAVQLAGGPSSCSFGCVGFGDCVKACQYGAVEICSGVAHIDPARCKGCSLCVSACPKQLITLVPFRKQAVVRCSSCDKGAQTNRVCKIGCIGCMKCEKTCEFNATHVKNFHASVGPAACTGCGKCAEVCPRHVIDLLSV